MIKKDKLHELIHALTKSEKRFFKLYSSLSGDAKQKKYLKLFEALQHVKNYNEEKVIDFLEKKGVSINNNWGSDKNYLYAQILETLRIQHTTSSAMTKARFHLDTSTILYQKGLIEQALQECIKSKKLSFKYHLISILPEVLLQERILQAFEGTTTAKLNDMKEELNSSLTNISNFNEADYHYRLVINELIAKGKARTEEEKKYANSLLKQLEQFPKDLGLHTSIRRYQGLAVHHFINNDPTKEYEYINRIIDLMENHVDFKQENQYEYITFLSHALRLSKIISPEKFQEKLTAFFEVPEKMKQDKKKVSARIYSLGHSTNLVKLLEEGDYNKGINLKSEIKSILKEYNSLIPRSVHMTFEYKFAYLHFGESEFTEALKHINVVLNEYNENDRKDVYSFSRILSLIIHYELGNYSLISYYIRSVFNFLKKREQLYTFENIMLQTIKILPRAKNKDEKKAIFIEKRIELIEYFKSQPNQEHILEFFDFITWIDSKIQEIPFKEMKLINIRANLK